VQSKSITELTELYTGQGIWVRFYVRARARLLNIQRYPELLPHNGLIIDIGCGYGVLANYLSLHLPKNQVLGIDLNYKRIDSANMSINNRKNITFRIEDASNSALPDCEGIVMTDFLHHVCPPDQQKILENAFLSLRKGGVLLISEADPGAKPFYRYWASYLSDRVLYPLSKSYFRKSSDWENTLSRLGFKVGVVRLRNPIFAGILFTCRK
jgi:2-polyprenyl-3-methyl-5-hydroxy-6-metoxy-1,4-benzoquinol methylase